MTHCSSPFRVQPAWSMPPRASEMAHRYGRSSWNGCSSAYRRSSFWYSLNRPSWVRAPATTLSNSSNFGGDVGTIWAWAETANSASANRDRHRRVMARPRERVANRCRLANRATAGQGGCRGCDGWGRRAGGANGTGGTVVASVAAWYRYLSL